MQIVGKQIGRQTDLELEEEVPAAPGKPAGLESNMIPGQVINLNDRIMLSEQTGIITHMHTGTSFVREILFGGVRIWDAHTHNRRKVDKVLECKNKFTTVRDPYDVMATWANRIHHGQQSTPKIWGDEESDFLCYEGKSRGQGFIYSWRIWWEIFNMDDVEAIYVDSYKPDLSDKDIAYKANHMSDDLGVRKAVKEGDWETFFLYVPREVADAVFEIGCPFERRH